MPTIIKIVGNLSHFYIKILYLNENISLKFNEFLFHENKINYLNLLK